MGALEGFMVALPNIKREGRQRIRTHTLAARTKFGAAPAEIYVVENEFRTRYRNDFEKGAKSERRSERGKSFRVNAKNQSQVLCENVFPITMIYGALPNHGLVTESGNVFRDRKHEPMSGKIDIENIIGIEVSAVVTR
jgi:hypothetical protein